MTKDRRPRRLWRTLANVPDAPFHLLRCSSTRAVVHCWDLQMLLEMPVRERINAQHLSRRFPHEVGRRRRAVNSAATLLGLIGGRHCLPGAGGLSSRLMHGFSPAPLRASDGILGGTAASGKLHSRLPWDDGHPPSADCVCCYRGAASGQRTRAR